MITCFGCGMEYWKDGIPNWKHAEWCPAIEVMRLAQKIEEEPVRNVVTELIRWAELWNSRNEKR